MKSSRTLLLDTSVLLHLVRNNRVGRSIESRFQLRTRGDKPLISIITLGEALAFSRKLAWGPSKVEALEDLFEDLYVVDLSDEILETYADIEVRLSRTGRPIQQNDIWIAATAIASKAHLLTTDKDFDPLYPDHLDRTWIDPRRPDA